MKVRGTPCRHGVVTLASSELGRPVLELLPAHSTSLGELQVQALIYRIVRTFMFNYIGVEPVLTNLTCEVSVIKLTLLK